MPPKLPEQTETDKHYFKTRQGHVKPFEVYPFEDSPPWVQDLFHWPLPSCAWAIVAYDGCSILARNKLIIKLGGAISNVRSNIHTSRRLTVWFILKEPE